MKPELQELVMPLLHNTELHYTGSVVGAGSVMSLVYVNDEAGLYCCRASARKVMLIAVRHCL